MAVEHMLANARKHADKLRVGHDLAVLGICENDILKQNLFNQQANALVASDVQLPFRLVGPILTDIVSQLPGTCAPQKAPVSRRTVWVMRLFIRIP